MGLKVKVMNSANAVSLTLIEGSLFSSCCFWVICPSDISDIYLYHSLKEHTLYKSKCDVIVRILYIYVLLVLMLFTVHDCSLFLPFVGGQINSYLLYFNYVIGDPHCLSMSL